MLIVKLKKIRRAKPGFTINCTPELDATIKAIAEQYHSTIQSVVIALIEKGIEANQKEDSRTKK
jgi:hypothetical protein